MPPSGFEPENLGRNELYSVGFPSNLGPSHRESISFLHCKYTNLFFKNQIFFLFFYILAGKSVIAPDIPTFISYAVSLYFEYGTLSVTVWVNVPPVNVL